MTRLSNPVIAHFLWGHFFTDLDEIYRMSPYKPPISAQGFKGRVHRRFVLMGEVTSECLLRALLSTSLTYEGGGGIYLIQQNSTGLKYYGRSDCPYERIRSHKMYFGQQKCRLQLEMAKAGLDDFRFAVLFQGDILRASLKLIERSLIMKENTIWPHGLNSA